MAQDHSTAGRTDIEIATERLKECLPIYLQQVKGVRKKLTGNINCIYGTHTDSTPSMKYYKNDNTVYCFTCGKRATIIDLIMQDIGTTDFMEALKYGCHMYDINIDGHSAYTYEHKHMDINTETQQQPAAEQDYTNFYKVAAEKLKMTSYHRGISLETLCRFNVGYVEKFEYPGNPDVPISSRLIIPTSKSTYIARATDATNKCRFLNVGSKELFNAAALYGQRPVFITEGEIDAMSIIDAGGEAVGLGGIDNAGKLLLKCEEKRPAVPLLLALDLDKPKQDGRRPGQDKTTEIIATLKGKNIPYIDVAADLYTNGCKDANEALQANKEAFTAAIKKAEQAGYDIMQRLQAAQIETVQKESAAGYKQAFATRVKENKEQAAISTGFTRLDNDLDGGLYPGLYTIGAITSLGKTTFALQIADTIADAGKDVMIFSLEMDKYELMAKSISRLTYTISCSKCLKGKNSAAKTTRAILNGRESYSQLEEDIRQEAISRYFDTKMGQHVYIKEGLGTVNVTTIEEYVKEHQEKTGKAPVVILDYLQILAPADPKATDKQNIDTAVLKLKQLSRDCRTPVIVISSINRTSYKDDKMEMQAYKESGAIEYGSDVLIGLKGNDEQGIELTETEAKTITLTVLKNRNGKKDKDGIEYSFFSAFNYFQEMEK